MLTGALSKVEREYVAAWKWLATRKSGFGILLPPMVLPSFDIIRLEGEHLSHVRTVPTEVMSAHNDTVDIYGSIRAPSFLYQSVNPENSERKAHDVVKSYQVPQLCGRTLSGLVAACCFYHKSRAICLLWVMLGAELSTRS
jgi:hypothetical protein